MAKRVQPVKILPPHSSSDSSSDDEIQDQDGSSGTDDEQQLTMSQKTLNQEPQNEDSEADSDETRNSPFACAFTVKPPTISEPVSKCLVLETPTLKSAKVKESDKAPKAVSKNQPKGNGGNSNRRAEVEKSKKRKVLNGEGQSVGKVEKGSKSKVSNRDRVSVGKVKNDSKSKKGISGDDESGHVEEKKSVFKWSKEDEVVLLDEIINYKAETGEDVNSNMVAFHEDVKDLFSVTKIQLYEKIRRLKKKFKTNEDKWKNGEGPVFSKQHDSVLFELSKRIWGSEGTVTDGNDNTDGNVVGNTSTPVEPVTSREHFVQEENRDTFMEDEVEVMEDYWSLYPSLCASIKSEAAGYQSVRVKNLNEYVKKIISRFGEEKARELEDEWKAVQLMDHQLYARRVHLISKQAQVVSDFFNQSG